MLVYLSSNFWQGWPVIQTIWVGTLEPKGLSTPKDLGLEPLRQEIQAFFWFLPDFAIFSMKVVFCCRMDNFWNFLAIWICCTDSYTKIILEFFFWKRCQTFFWLLGFENAINFKTAMFGVINDSFWYRIWKYKYNMVQRIVNTFDVLFSKF